MMQIKQVCFSWTKTNLKTFSLNSLKKDGQTMEILKLMGLHMFVTRPAKLH